MIYICLLPESVYHSSVLCNGYLLPPPPREPPPREPPPLLPRDEPLPLPKLREELPMLLSDEERLEERVLLGRE